jgi:hypothetical protein
MIVIAFLPKIAWQGVLTALIASSIWFLAGLIPTVTFVD